jgi:hypothetical protein
MTWGELKAALQDWGVGDEESLAAVRLDQAAQAVGIRRTSSGIEVVAQGCLWTPERGEAADDGLTSLTS